MALDYLQKVITDTHALIAHEQDPKLKQTYASCLKELLGAQAQKMADPQQMAQAATQQQGQAADPRLGALLAQLGG